MKQKSILSLYISLTLVVCFICVGCGADKNLKKAEKMSYRAITAEANNPIYLDTYAWILYKQKRYEDAKAYIDMALEYLKDGGDPDEEIRHHAEKINKKLKKK